MFLTKLWSGLCSEYVELVFHSKPQRYYKKVSAHKRKSVVQVR